MYTSEERLGKDDAYFCPQCNKKREVVKKLGVWSVPDVMVVHLKRFRQSTISANKLETLVEFPLEGFDMSPNMARAAEPGPSSPEAQPSSLKTTFSPWKHPKRFRAYDREETVYELYSVCNHHGSDLLGGHYTAYCKNPTDGRWYSFDDMQTRQVEESEVVGKDAYILFYQKSCLNPSSSSSSSSGSSTSSTAEHWVYRMPDFCYKTKNETRCAPTSKPRSEKKEKTKTNSDTATAFTRNSAKYATLPVKKSKTFEFDRHSDTETGDKGDSSDDDTETER